MKKWHNTNRLCATSQIKPVWLALLLLTGLGVAAQEAAGSPFTPLTQSGGFHTASSYSANLMFTTDTSGDYEWLIQALQRLRFANYYGRRFGVSTGLSLNTMSLSSTASSLYRYRGFDSLAGTVGAFVNLGENTKLPFDVLLELGGGAALAMYPETYTLFYMPIAEAVLRFYFKNYQPFLFLPQLALSLSLELPIIFPAGGISIGAGLGLSLVFMPAVRYPATGEP